MVTDIDPTESVDFTAEVREQDGAKVIGLSGELDLATADDLRAALLSAAMTRTPSLRVDLSQVTFIDSCSIGLLVSACNRVRAAGGTFTVMSGPSNVRRVFEISGLVDFFEMDAHPQWQKESGPVSVRQIDDAGSPSRPLS